jgi:quercetin dioxygenase-like cupin family protein
MTLFTTTEPTALASLVETQPDAVVSRVILRTDGCTITAFAFDEGQGLTEHTSPHTAVVVALEGGLTLTMRPDGEAERTHSLKAGDALTIPGGVPHALHGGAEFKMLLILAKADADSGATER